MLAISFVIGGIYFFMVVITYLASRMSNDAGVSVLIAIIWPLTLSIALSISLYEYIILRIKKE